MDTYLHKHSDPYKGGGLHARNGKASIQDWATWIQGDVILGRRVISLNYVNLQDVLEFLYEETPFQRVLVTQSPPAAIRGIGRTSRALKLENLMFDGHVTPGFWIVANNLVIVPAKNGATIRTTSARKTYEWAVRHKLPYIFMHDNDHAWFSMFSSAVEKRLFLRFLSLSLFRSSSLEWRLSNSDWRIVRQGIIAHGWTLNRQLCSCRDGVLNFMLWGGVPRVQLFRNTDAQRFSHVKKGLKVRIDSDGTVSIRAVRRACPLREDYGSLSPVPGEAIMRGRSRRLFLSSHCQCS